MPNGKPHDHPLTDILVHRLEVYGPEADGLIRKISELSSPAELNEWWETQIGFARDRSLALEKAKVRYAELSQRAVDRGWEVD